MSSSSDERTCDFVREVIKDLGELGEVALRIGKLGASDGLPIVTLEFESARVGYGVPTLAIALASADGTPYVGDKLRRVVRNSVERYLHRCGVPRPARVKFAAPIESINQHFQPR